MNDKQRLLNEFFSMTREKGFVADDMSVEVTDKFARDPMFVFNVFYNRRILADEGKRACLRVIDCQAKEIAEQAKGRGTWKREIALKVAKVWISHYCVTYRACERAYTTDKEVQVWFFIPGFTAAHEAASDMIKNVWFKEPMHRARVAKACSWLRETKESVLAHPKWHVPDGIYEGLELLKMRLEGLEIPKGDKDDIVKITATPTGKLWVVVVGGEYTYNITRPKCIEVIERLRTGDGVQMEKPTPYFQNDHVIEQKISKDRRKPAKATPQTVVALGDHERFAKNHLLSNKGWWRIVVQKARKKAVSR